MLYQRSLHVVENCVAETVEAFLDVQTEAGEPS